MGKDNGGFTPAIYVQGANQNNNGCCDTWNVSHDAAETANCGCENSYAAVSASETCGCENNSSAAYGKRRNKQKCSSREDGTHVIFEACDGAQAICVSGTCEDLQCMGRILDVTTTLHNVCPGRRSAVGLTLSEVDEDGSEYARGFRALTVPAHNGNCNRDIQLDSVRFILPEDLSLQRRRHFICRVSHHYMDADSIWD